MAIGQSILSLLQGDPSSQMGQTLNPNPVNPSPMAQGSPPGGPGAPPAPGGPAPPPQPALPPAQATQSPPDLAALYAQLHSQDQRANAIDKGTAMMASAFGTAQQQHDMMNYAQSLRPDDRTDMLGQAIKSQGELTQQQNEKKFQAGAAGMGSILGVDPKTAQWLALNPDAMNDAMKTHFANKTETETQKDVDAAGAIYAQAHPEATPADIANYKNQMLSYKINPVMADVAKQKALTTQENQENFATADTRGTAIEQNLEWLQQHPAEAAHAVSLPEWMTSGQTGAWDPLVSQDTKLAKAKLDQLKSQLEAGQLQTSGMSRMAQMEFQKLGLAMTALKPQMSQQEVTDEINRLTSQAYATHGNLYGGAGLAVDPKYSGFANPGYFDPNNPMHTGATVPKDAPAPGSKLSGGGGKHYTFNPSTGKLE
jgi:hypothetical protein